MAVNDACLAQQNPHDQHSSNVQLGELLQVPKSPVPSKRQKPRSQTVPPPPGVSGQVTGVVVAAGGKASSQSAQETPADDIKQLERGFIQQQIPGKVPKAPPKSVSSRRPSVVAQNAQEQMSQFSGASLGQPNIQATPLPASLGGTTVTQEFTAPSAPT
ncbi:MAG: porin, partial [Scytonema sp. CRU_2_7]|nr:porin [Scytonema sp. CRU_2_7]